VPLSEELQFIDDYLDIEVARSAADNLEIVKQLGEETLELCPQLLLQAVVEKLSETRLRPKLARENSVANDNGEGRLHIEIEDNRRGHFRREDAARYVEGIGLSNVRERCTCSTELIQSGDPEPARRRHGDPH